MKKLTKQNLALYANLLLIVLELIGFVLCVPKYGVGMLRYYTQDSNLFALLASVIYVAFALHGKSQPKWAVQLRYMACCGLTLTFLIVLCVLIPLEGKGAAKNLLLSGAMPYHHVLCPLLSLLSFLRWEDTGTLTRGHAVWAMVPTLCYATVAVILNVLRLMDGPYPFLRVYNQPVLLSCVWAVVVLGVALAIAEILRHTKNDHLAADKAAQTQ